MVLGEPRTPTSLLERIELVPPGPPFLVAGITLGHARRASVRPHAGTAGPAGGHRPRPAPAADGRARRSTSTAASRPTRSPLADGDDRPGYGAGNAPPTARAPPTPHVAALPSATVDGTTARRRTRPGPLGDVERDGQAATDRVRVELVDPGRNWVHVTVLDDATGQPVPCRVHFRSPEGMPYQPHGHHHHVNQNLGSWHYDVGGDVRLGQTDLRLHRRHLPGLASAR